LQAVRLKGLVKSKRCEREKGRRVSPVVDGRW